MSKSIHESTQYSDRSIRRYEKIFGADFMSSGGLDYTTKICEELGLHPGARVLDVGSGLGGSAFLMNRKFGAVVTGVDILPQMISLSTQRAKEYGLSSVTFIEGDIFKIELPEASFDVVYSRDAFLYIEDKLALFRKLLKLLAPGGRLFVSDYACGADGLTEEFRNYSSESGYYLVCPEAYGAIVEEAGFIDVQARDMTEAFIELLQGDIKRIMECADDPEDIQSQEDKDYLVQRWDRKVRWCENGDMKWAHICARRS